MAPSIPGAKIAGGEEELPDCVYLVRPLTVIGLRRDDFSGIRWGHIDFAILPIDVRQNLKEATRRKLT